VLTAILGGAVTGIAETVRSAHRSRQTINPGTGFWQACSVDADLLVPTALRRIVAVIEETRAVDASLPDFTLDADALGHHTVIDDADLA
jgi:hypothetical protein